MTALQVSCLYTHSSKKYGLSAQAIVALPLALARPFFTLHNFGKKWLLHGALAFQNVVSDISIHIANNQYVDSADIGNK